MAGNATEVQKLYVAYFSRPADAGGLDYWTRALANNPGALQEMSRQFSISQEYRDLYAGMDSRAMVTEVYDNLFGRAAEKAGVDYWAGLLDSRQVSIDNMVTQIAAGARDSDLFAWNAKVAAANAFAVRLDQPNEKSAYTGAVANQMAIDWIASVKNLETAAMAQDPGVIDALISRMVGANNAAVDDVQLVGIVAQPEPAYI